MTAQPLRSRKVPNHSFNCSLRATKRNAEDGDRSTQEANLAPPTTSLERALGNHVMAVIDD
jgi:hypothetical protein